jgi:universal stress protein A
MKNNETRHYQRILAGAALRQSSYPTVRRALWLAAREGAGLYLLHAMDNSPEEATPNLPSTLDSAAKAKEQLDRLQASHPEIREVRIATDRCWRALKDTAEELDADLIVIGTHIHGRLQALLGNTGDQVLQHMSRDVLMVLTPAGPPEQPLADYRHLLVVSDLQPHCAAAARRAAGLAADLGARVSLLHVVEHFPTDRENDVIAPENEDPLAYLQRIRARDLQAFAVANGLATAAQRVEVTEKSAQVLVPEIAREIGADLLVLGAPAPTVRHRLLGSTADAIVHHAPCDCLLVIPQA